jgi:N-acetylmuramoyl-L-alanine amidase
MTARIAKQLTGLLLWFASGIAWADPAFTLAIDIGHTPGKPGAISARGQPEYGFNQAMATHLLARIRKTDRLHAFIINPGGAEISLNARSRAAAAAGADLLLSIHHDSLQPHYLQTWQYQGLSHRYSDRFQGYSLFLSHKNPRFKQGLRFATLLGTQLLDAGLRPTLHHAEAIKGENRPLLDRRRGIYRFDNLVVLKKSTMPAVLLECGVILNRAEEAQVNTPAYREQVADALIAALEQYIDGASARPGIHPYSEHKPETPD